MRCWSEVVARAWSWCSATGAAWCARQTTASATYDGRWVEAGQLLIGVDEVAVGVEYPESAGGGVGAGGGWRLDTRTTLGYDLDMAERAPHSLAFARLLGYVLSDGCVTSDVGWLYLGHQLDLDAALRDVFLLTATRPAVTRNRRTFDFRLPRPVRHAFLDVVGVTGKRTAQVSHFPAFVTHLDCPLPVVREFLGALFGGDGHTLRLSHKRGKGASMGGLGYGTTRVAALAAEQRQLLQGELFALLQRVGVDTSGITSAFNTVAPNTQTKKGRKELKQMQSQGLTVAPRRTADTLDASRSYVLLQLLPTVVAWLPRKPAELQPRKKGKGASNVSLLDQLTAMDSRRFFSERRKKRRYSAAARRLELSSHSPAPAVADVIDLAVSDGDEVDSRRVVPKRRKRNDSAAEGDEAAAAAAEAERPVGATEQPRRATRRDVNYAEEQLPGEPAEDAEVSEADERGAEDAQDDADEGDEEEEEESMGSSGGDSDGEGYDGEFKSADKVTYGVHRDARVLPLFRVRLIGRRAAGERRVWDLSVPSPQGDLSRSFVANGVVVHNCIQVEKARHLERENAARLIQFVWRNYRHERELAEKLQAKNPRLYEEISALEEKEFMEEFLARSKLLRNVRRERVELEEQLIGRGGAGGGGGGSARDDRWEATGGRSKALGGEGGKEDYEDGLVRVGGASAWSDRRDDEGGVQSQLRRLREQNEEILRWMRALYNDREKKRGRRERRQQKRQREEEARQQRALLSPDAALGEGAAALSSSPLPPSAAGAQRRAKQERKALRHGRGEAEGADSGALIAEVDETTGAARPLGVGRRRSISYGELRELERWGEGERKAEEAEATPGAAVEEKKEDGKQPSAAPTPLAPLHLLPCPLPRTRRPPRPS